MTIAGPASPSSTSAQAVATMDPDGVFHARTMYRGRVIGAIAGSRCHERPGERIVGLHAVRREAMCERCYGMDADAAIAEAERITRRATSERSDVGHGSSPRVNYGGPR